MAAKEVMPLSKYKAGLTQDEKHAEDEVLMQDMHEMEPNQLEKEELVPAQEQPKLIVAYPCDYRTNAAKSCYSWVRYRLLSPLDGRTHAVGVASAFTIG